MSNVPSSKEVTSKLILSCIRKRDSVGLKKLIDKGTSVNASPTEGGQSLVMLACSAQDMETVQMLITAGSNLNYLDKASTSVASIISSNGSSAILQLLLDNGLDLELLSQPNYQGCTPAHFAAQMGHIAILDILKYKGATLNTPDSDKSTPSHMAAFHGKKDTLQWFETQTDVVINAVHSQIIKNALITSKDPNFNQLQTQTAKAFRHYGTTMRSHLETQTWLRGECHRCLKHGATRKCSKCKEVFYCSQDCQVVDWKQGGHKAACGKLPPPTTATAPSFNDVTLPCYYLKLDTNTEKYLTVSARVPINYLPSAIDLLTHGLVKTEVDTSDESKFISDVFIYDEQHSKTDKAVAYIHREGIRLLCGEEGVAALELHRRMGTSSWFMTGGPRGPAERQPVLHVTKNIL